MEKKTKDIVAAMAHGPVQRYIRDHENEDVRDLVLKHKDILGIPTAELIQQITTRRKAREKLPLYYNRSGAIFPPPVNFEQTSSEVTARYKSDLISRLVPFHEGNAADLTGGFGVDAFFLSSKVRKLHFVEPQVSLLELARHNHHLLGASNMEYHSMTAEQFLMTARQSFDFMYADPSRRTAEKKKIYTLESSQPDIVRLSPMIFERTRLMVVKASPLLDIQAGMRQLACAKNVFVISVANECKEVLFVCERDFEGICTIEAVNISDGAVAQSFAFSFPEERSQSISLSDPLSYLYEPGVSVLKAGAFKSVAARYNIKKIAANTHLYTSGHPVENFPGKTFLIEAFVKPDAAALKKFFPDGKANVVTRNYPLSPEALKKKVRLKDGGEQFLIAFSGQKRKFLVVAKKL